MIEERNRVYEQRRREEKQSKLWFQILGAELVGLSIYTNAVGKACVWAAADTAAKALGEL